MVARISLALMPMPNPAAMIAPVLVPPTMSNICWQVLPVICSSSASMAMAIMPRIPPPSIDRMTFLPPGLNITFSPLPRISLEDNGKREFAHAG